MDEPVARRTIAVVLYPDLTALDLVGPLQVLSALERLDPSFHVVVVGAHTNPMTTDVTVALAASATFEDVPHPFAILVPGGRGGTIRAMSDPVIRAYVEQASATADLVTSVCTGSLILGAVGLLEGRPAATNWFFSGVLGRFGARYRHVRWVHDGRFVTSAGVSAGIDMALYLVGHLTDETTARRVQAIVDYDPAPPFGAVDWQHVELVPRLLRGAIRVAAPILAARPNRLRRRARRGIAAAAGAR